MKPAIIEQIEQLWGDSFELHPAPVYPNDPLAGLMAYKTGYPKYAVEGDRLVGLNLAATGLDDDKWEKIVKLLEKESVGLKALSVSENKLLNFLPPPNITALQRLEVDDNPLSNLPKEIVRQGNEAILNYFRQIEEQEGSVPLYEAKLLIVGEPAAGKTTLFKKLIDSDYLAPPDGDKNLKSTVGISIMEGWEFPYQKDGTILFKANLWDFGGQEIQYMTHHFFLTPRALYVLVADDRKQNTEFDYWFRIIHLLGRESEEEKISVLVVLNEINHVSVTNFDLAKYRRDYPGMDIQMWEVDFSEKDYRSDGLAGKVKDMLSCLPHIGDSLPRLWAPIREDLIGRRKERPHITFEEFSSICSKERNGMRLQREEDQRYLSSYLHRLGVMLHYQDDDFLDNFVILHPQWAVDAVYVVLKDDRVVKNHGRFTKEDLRDLWKNYKPDERSRLLTLMLKDKFEICYPSSRSDEYIAPQLLPSKRPAYEWDGAGAMKFRYQYSFMPKGLISRLIVRLSEDIAEGGALVWKEGVVIERDGCRAQIVQGKTVKEGLEVLEIELRGPERERKYLLRHVMTEVEKIHEKSFKHITFEKMIPCTCEYCKGSEQPTFFEYSELLQYEHEGWDHIPCRNGKLKKVLVKSLLEGVFEKDYSALKSKVRALIKESRVEEALEELEAGFPEEDQVVMFRSQWSAFQKELLDGKITFENKETRQNQIKSGILDFVADIQHGGFDRY
jgi:internalin A